MKLLQQRENKINWLFMDSLPYSMEPTTSNKILFSTAIEQEMIHL